MIRRITQWLTASTPLKPIPQSGRKFGAKVIKVTNR
jgi:hypothetical protein